VARDVKSSDSAKELTQSINDWAEAFGHSSDPYLQSLISDMEAGRNLEYWASVDPIEYLPNSDSVTSIPILRWARLASGARNIIIFLPVALTWAGVSQATTKFNDFVKSNEGTPANFLQFWQDGYGLLDDFWKIGSIAMLDFMLVALVILLSAFVAVAQTRGQMHASRLSASFSRERRLLGLKIKIYLFAHKTVSVAQVPGDVQKSVEALKVAMRDMQAVVEGLKKSTSKLGETVPVIAEQSAISQKTLLELNTKLQKQIEEFTKQIDKSGSLVSNSLKLVLDQTSKTVSQMLSQVDATGTSIKSSSRAIQDQIESLQRELNRKS